MTAPAAQTSSANRFTVAAIFSAAVLLTAAGGLIVAGCAKQSTPTTPQAQTKADGDGAGGPDRESKNAVRPNAQQHQQQPVGTTGTMLPVNTPTDKKADFSTGPTPLPPAPPREPVAGGTPEVRAGGPGPVGEKPAAMGSPSEPAAAAKPGEIGAASIEDQLKKEAAAMKAKQVERAGSPADKPRMPSGTAPGAPSPKPAEPADALTVRSLDFVGGYAGLVRPDNGAANFTITTSNRLSQVPNESHGGVSQSGQRIITRNDRAADRGQAGEKDQPRDATDPKDPKSQVGDLGNRGVGAAAAGVVVPTPMVLPRFPGVLPAEHEELWIIQRDPQTLQVTPAQDKNGNIISSPTSGSLIAHLSESQSIALTLDALHVSARVDGPIANVTYSQIFSNPLNTNTDATYILPLPTDAGVYDFVMTIGQRQIRGVIRDRAEAANIYAAAQARGHQATLISLDANNAYAARVSNIAAKSTVEVTISYFHVCPFEGDSWVLRVPFKSNPQFNPITSAKPFASSVKVAVNTGMPLEGLESPSHTVKTVVGDDRFKFHGTAELTGPLGSGSITDRDFELRIRVATDVPKTGLITYTNQKGDTYFAALAVPPKEYNASTTRYPMEYVLVIDRSAAMSAESLAQAKAVAIEFIKNLDPNDVYRVILSTDDIHPGEGLVKALPPQRLPVVKGIEALTSAGPDLLLPAIRRAMSLKNEPIRPRFVVFISAGQLTDEGEVLSEIQNRLHVTTRFIPVSVGAAANRPFMQHLAKCGRGTAMHIQTLDDVKPMVTRFFSQFARAPLTEIRTGFTQTKGQDVYPRVAMDLQVGRPVMIVGRWVGVAPSPISIGARAGYDARINLLNPAASDLTRGNRALSMVWARRRTADFADYATSATIEDVEKNIRETCLNQGIVSPWTALLAVDALPPKPSAESDPQK